MKRKLFVLKVSLKGIEPEIWRRFVVPSDITLDRLHDVIQIVMGWEDYHLHQFTIEGKRYTEYRESLSMFIFYIRYKQFDLGAGFCGAVEPEISLARRL